jgi:replication fork protection complex subunit Csm3/Swi3
MDASIWDEPLTAHSPRRASEERRPIDIEDDDDEVPQRPKKRARQTLFYADSDDDIDLVPGPSNAETVLKAPPPHDIDIDALFAGVDDDEEISQLPAILDEAELTRRAEARYKNNAPPLTLHEILPSSSPGREVEGGNAKKKSKDDEKKGRQRQLRLDENLLLSPTGFPQLVKMAKDFKIKGKGHEVSRGFNRFESSFHPFLQAADLDRLLRIYQYWTHQLYPKTTFTDTIDRVEKLCHSRRMNVRSYLHLSTTKS